MTRPHATAIGSSAIVLWAFLALLTVRTAPTPPLLLTAIAFALGGAAGLAWTVGMGRLGVLAQVPASAYLFATAGLFGYHFCYFTALRLAQAAEAGLVAYLWPLLIVLLSGLLPGERLRPLHVAGAVTAFAGLATLILGRAEGFDAAAWPGLGMALLCAAIWAIYSVGSRALGSVPTEALTMACLATALLSGTAHLLTEATAWPIGAAGWGAAILLGIGPLGAAFFTWDVGVKRGDIQLLATASYAAPLLSTLVLIVAGEARPTPSLVAAALLVAGGAALAAGASRRARREVNASRGA